MIDAGKLDRTLQFLIRSRTQDAAGQIVDTWAAGAIVRAEQLTLTQTDLKRAARDNDKQGVARRAQVVGKYRIRWRSDVTKNMRVRIDGTEYAITALDTPDRRQSIVLTLEAI